MTLISVCSIVILYYLKLGPWRFVSDCNRLFALIISISLFMFFKNMKLRNSKIINTISASTFGVLLIHDNSTRMQKWLWSDFLNVKSLYNEDSFIIKSIFYVIAIYIVCIMIDFIRRKVETKLLSIFIRTKE